MTAETYFEEKLNLNPDNSGSIVLEQSFPGFQGHFPGMPVLPGICFIMLARVFMEKMLRKQLAVQSIRKAKFFAPALPGDTMIPEGTYSEENGIVTANVVIHSAAGTKTADIRFTLHEVSK